MTQTQSLEEMKNSDGSTYLQDTKPKSLYQKVESFVCDNGLYFSAAVCSLAIVGGLYDGKRRTDFNENLREKIYAETLVIYKNAPVKRMNVYGGYGLDKIVKDITHNNLQVYRQSGDYTPQAAAIATGFMTDNKDKIKDVNSSNLISYSNFKPVHSIPTGVFGNAHVARNLSQDEVNRINTIAQNYSAQFK